MKYQFVLQSLFLRDVMLEIAALLCLLAQI